MTEKDKMAQIIAENLCPNGKTHKQLFGEQCMCYSRNNFAECEKICNCVDFLVAAGIGDVGETKEKLKKINERILLGDIIACDLSAKCAEYKYRAEVAEKMFNILYEETSEYMKVLSKEWYKYQAEKELAEGKKDE